MTGAVSIAHDYEGLRKAALELLEEDRRKPDTERLERAAGQSANLDEFLAKCGGERSLAEGYYLRIGYLAELENMLKRSGQMPGSELELSELRGLQMLDSARSEFEHLHPPCRGCGVRLEHPWLKICAECENASRPRS